MKAGCEGMKKLFTCVIVCLGLGLFFAGCACSWSCACSDGDLCFRYEPYKTKSNVREKFGTPRDAATVEELMDYRFVLYAKGRFPEIATVDRYLTRTDTAKLHWDYIFYDVDDKIVYSQRFVFDQWDRRIINRLNRLELPTRQPYFRSKKWKNYLPM